MEAHVVSVPNCQVIMKINSYYGTIMIYGKHAASAKSELFGLCILFGHYVSMTDLG